MRLTSLRVHRRKAVVDLSLPGSSRSSPSAADPMRSLTFSESSRLTLRVTGSRPHDKLVLDPSLIELLLHPLDQLQYQYNLNQGQALLYICGCPCVRELSAGAVSIWPLQIDLETLTRKQRQGRGQRVHRTAKARQSTLLKLVLSPMRVPIAYGVDAIKHGSMPFPVEIDSTTNMTVAPVFAGDRRHHGVLR